jgi:hypothetical protein
VTAQSAGGLDVNSGSNKQVQQSQEKIKDIDMESIRSNAAKIAYDYDTKAVMDDNQAGLDVIAGKNAKDAGELGAISSIIGTVSGVSTKWQQGKTTGLW